MDERLCFLICLIIVICSGYSESRGENFCGEHVPCDDWQCIDKGKWCNGETDCFDESDEKYCRTSSWIREVDNKCTEQHFKCDNDQCVPVVTKCDGYKNCKDGSDEYYCDENSSETSLSYEDSTSEEKLESKTDEVFWDISVTTTEHETSFPDTFESPEPPAIALIPQPTPDYYSRRISRVPTDRQNQAGRNREFDHNSRRDHRQQLYPGTQNEPRQQRQHHDTRYDTHTRTELTRQSETLRGSSQHSGGSDTAPTASFPSNEHRPPSPPTADPISLSPSPLSVDKDTGRLEEFNSTRQETALPPFHFRQNYTHHFSYRYKDSIQRAESWIFDQRDSAYGWGMDTPRALVTLSLINNSFLSNATGKNFMKKSLQMHLGLKLLTELDTNNSFKTSGNSIKLAQYINALLATCQNPRNFFGQDLVERLWQMKNDVLRRERFVNPFIYITLCLVNATITNHDIGVLESVLASNDSNQRSKDIQIFATTALACLQHNKPELELDRKVERAFNDLRSRKLRDGSFGSVHSTAIAAQALMSGNIDWDPVQTLDYLKQHQSEDGSFGNMLATYYILPSLCGRSLLHLRNTRCDPPPTDEEGTHIRIFYTVKIGYPPTASIPNAISVPGGTSFFDVLRIAQLMNPVFKFSSYNSNGKIGVHGISGVVDDPEHGFYWHLYELGDQKTMSPNRSQEYTGDIRKLYPTNSQELVYWYHNL